VAEVLQAIDGFDDYGVAADVTAGSWASVGAGTLAAGNIAGQCFTPAQNTSPSRPYTGDPYVHHLFYWKTANAALATPVWRAFEGATEHLRLQYNGDGTFTFSRAGTNVGSTPTSGNLGIINGSWYHIEVLARCHDTLGQYDVYVNGVLACTGGATNLDTRNGGTAGACNAIYLNNALAQANSSYDDLLIYTGSPMVQKGMARVITKLPTGDGADTGWAASTGTRWGCVDDPAPNTTDYISSSTPNAVDSFTYPALGVTGVVLGVAPTSLALKDDAGTRTLRELIRQSGSDYPGAVDKPLTTSYAYYQEIWEAQPVGGAWTVSAVDSAEYGVKLIA
jgi:Concanavalin A-like lectin/glucanases superfamily